MPQFLNSKEYSRNIQFETENQTMRNEPEGQADKGDQYDFQL